MTEELFDRVLRKAMRRSTTTGRCPDPSELAAFVSHTMSRDERLIVEAHVSSCPRCAAELALIARLEGATESGAARSAGWSRWRWAIPLATAVVVFAVWNDLPRRWPEPSQPVQEVERGDEGRTFNPGESKGVAEVPGDVPSTLTKPTTENRFRGQSRRTPRPDSKSAPPANERILLDSEQAKGESFASTTPPTSPDGERDQLKDDRRADATIAEPASPSRQETGAAAAPLTAKRRALEPSAVPRSSREETEGIGQDRALSRLPPAAQDSLAAGLSITASDRIRVRVLANRIERTTDNGVTWKLERVLTVPVLAGTCPSADVCWLAGTSGLVLRRDPSGRWFDARLPVDANVTAILAGDALHATAITADGRRFATTDGGHSWSVVE